MKKVFLCDIDGTVADGTHRQHLIKTKPKNWPAYRKLAHLDKPIWPVINTVKALSQVHDVIFCSGRMEEERQVTTEWLWDVAKFDWEIGKYNLFMRPSKDSREDSIIKREIYQTMIRPHYEVVGVFDDRNRVIKMWREEGVFVFNINQTSLGDEF